MKSIAQNTLFGHDDHLSIDKLGVFIVKCHYLLFSLVKNHTFTSSY